MIRSMPQIESWTSHLLARVQEAKEIGLISEGDKLNLPSASLFLPDEIDQQQLEDIQPDSSLRKIQKQGIEECHGWIKRNDLFNEAAKWISDKFSTFGNVELFCEAGYSKKGDKILEARQHIILNEVPLLNLKLSTSSYETVEKTLRWGRSWRLIGVIANMSSESYLEGEDVRRLLFFCDVFDGDSIIVAEFIL